MRRIMSVICLLLLGLAVVLAGCSPGLDARDLMAGVKAAEWPAAPGALPGDFTDGTAEFSWNLMKASLSNTGNILISPASVYLALAMTQNGAGGETLEAMMTALGAQGMDLEVINKDCRDWITSLIKNSEGVQMSIANSIWYRTGFSADKAFLQTNADYFAAGAQVLDFNKPEAVTTINNWVRESTNGAIEKILEQIGPAAVMYLINTIYFKAEWKDPFILNFTADGSFLAPGGAVDVKIMHRTGDMAYLEKDGAAAVLLPYQDEQFSFFALLPADGVTPRQFLESADPSLIASLAANHQMTRVELSMPRFEVKYEDSLLNEMSDLGMGIAMSPGQADFSLMTEQRSKDLYISEIKHKTFCKINEIGTEAAAATLVEISKSAIAGGDKKLELNRPFIYGILDMDSGLPIFIGILETPGQ